MVDMIRVRHRSCRRLEHAGAAGHRYKRMVPARLEASSSAHALESFNSSVSLLSAPIYISIFLCLGILGIINSTNTRVYWTCLFHYSSSFSQKYSSCVHYFGLPPCWSLPFLLLHPTAQKLVIWTH
jgi:hypothetical protein